MNFLNPLVLVGLIAATIPLILHLLNLRKLKRIEFSTLQFLKELKKQQIKRLKLKQIILLILRTLIIICLVMAFSRPIVESELPVFEAYAKSSAVIILDNSVSMDINEERGNRLSLAKLAVIQLIDMLSDGSEISIITMSDPEYSNSTGLMQDYTYLKKEIGEIKISSKRGNLANSLKTANALLASATNVNKEIFIISDMQDNIFQLTEDDSVRFDKMNAKIYAVQIGKANSYPKNISVDSLVVITKIMRENTPVDINVVLKNHSESDADGTVLSLLYNNKRVAQRTVDIPSNQSRTVVISAIPNETGAIKGEVEIDGDALDQDNKRFFSLLIPEKISVLVVGAPNNNLQVFFNGISSIQNVIQTEFADEQKADASDLTKYDVLIINDGAYSQSQLEKFAKFIESGGFCYIFANTKSGKMQFQEFFRKIGYGKINEKTNPTMSAIEFSNVDKLHPLLDGVFKGTTDSRKPIETPLLKKYNTVSGGYAIISFPSGAFLAESNFGKGKSLYCSTGLDDEWGTYALSGLFPTLLYRGIVYLSNTETIQKNYFIDDQILVRLSNGIVNQDMVKVLDPDNFEAYYKNMHYGNDAVIELKGIDKCGSYTIMNNANKAEALVSVNMNPNESNISPEGRREKVSTINQWFTDKSKISYIEDSKDLTSEIVKERLGTELWKVFALLALLFAIAEMIVSRYAFNDQ
jgi:hypothetical protein